MLSRSFCWKVFALQGFPLKLRDILFLGIRLAWKNVEDVVVTWSVGTRMLRFCSSWKSNLSSPQSEGNCLSLAQLGHPKQTLRGPPLVAAVLILFSHTYTGVTVNIGANDSHIFAFSDFDCAIIANFLREYYPFYAIFLCFQKRSGSGARHHFHFCNTILLRTIARTSPASSRFISPAAPC